MCAYSNKYISLPIPTSLRRVLNKFKYLLFKLVFITLTNNSLLGNKPNLSRYSILCFLSIISSKRGFTSFCNSFSGSGSRKFCVFYEFYFIRTYNKRHATQELFYLLLRYLFLFSPKICLKEKIPSGFPFSI